MPKTTTDNRPELKPVNFGAAAIDIGSKMHMAAVNPAVPMAAACAVVRASSLT